VNNLLFEVSAVALLQDSNFVPKRWALYPMLRLSITRITEK
ncbi:uncharacterized protein METZ01_LOCUS365884, partial [marine metagenome]